MQLIGRTDSYKVLINYRAQRHVETCLWWKGRDSAIIYRSRDQVPGNRRRRFGTATLPSFGKTVHNVFTSLSGESVSSGHRYFPSEDKCHKLKEHQTQGKSSPMALGARRTCNPEERSLREMLTKKLWTRSLRCPVPGTNGFFNPRYLSLTASGHLQRTWNHVGLRTGTNRAGARSFGAPGASLRGHLRADGSHEWGAAAAENTSQQPELCGSNEACDELGQWRKWAWLPPKKEKKTVRRRHNVKLISCIHVVGASVTL